MSDLSVTEPYPGEGADANSLLALARAYDAAARSLREVTKRGNVASWSPMRLCAIHSLELYLSAYLMTHGAEPKEIRSLRHDLFERVSRGKMLGLSLKKKTFEHLARITDDREYLVMRYDPNPPKASEITRMMATLDEVGEKVGQAVEGEAK